MSPDRETGSPPAAEPRPHLSSELHADALSFMEQYTSLPYLL
jgi:hypothetical protein